MIDFRPKWKKRFILCLMTSIVFVSKGQELFFGFGEISIDETEAVYFRDVNGLEAPMVGQSSTP